MKRTLATASMALLSGTALASGFDINGLQNLNQAEFRELAQNLGAAFSYKPMAPADALGPLGFDIGAALTGTTLVNTATLQKAVGNSSVFSTLPQPSIRAIKGLPYNVDIGAFYTRVPSSNINLYGGEIKWAFLPGDIALPAVAVRGTATRLNGVSQLGFESFSADVSISKGFAIVTPYAGVGEVRSLSSTDGLPLKQVNLTQGKVFGGASFNLGLANLDLEADSTGGIHSYSAKVGVRF
jgi:hypothetical protein